MLLWLWGGHTLVYLPTAGKLHCGSVWWEMVVPRQGLLLPAEGEGT